MYIFFLSLQFLMRRFVNWICVICVALAVTVLLAVMAIMGGFQKQLLESYQSISSDLVVRANRVRDFSPTDLRSKIAEADHVVASTYRFYTFGFLGMEGQIHYGGSAGIKVWGIDPETEFETTDLRQHLENVADPDKDPRDRTPRVANLDDPFDTSELEDPDRRPKPGILVGDKLFQSLGVRVGEELQITTASFNEEYSRVTEPGEEPQDPVRGSQQTFLIVGTFSTGMYEYDNHTVYVPSEIEYDFLGPEGGGREIFVKIDDYENVEAARSSLEMKLPLGADVVTWQEQNRVFISAVQTEKMIQAVILSFMILLAGGAIMSVLTMIVVEKTRDVGTVKALGGTESGILGIFVMNGLIIGIVGSIAGLLLGILIIDNINFIDSQIIAKVIGHRIFRPDVYVFDEIPTAYDPTGMAITIGITLLVSFLASLVPAWKASRFRPVEALRYE